MFKPVLLGVALASAALCAQAGVSATNTQLTGTVITLSATNVSGGALYAQSVNHGAAEEGYAARPQGTVGTWLASGPDGSVPGGDWNWNNGGGDATLSLGAGITAVGLLWGSPDDYNKFTVNGYDTITSSSFSTSYGEWGSGDNFLGIARTGDQSTAYYLTFTGSAGSTINSIVFHSEGKNAIEIANVTVVPEPEAYGLALAGLGVVGFAMRRRRNS